MTSKKVQLELFHLSPEERKFLEMIRDLNAIKDDFMMLKIELLEIKSDMVETVDRIKNIEILESEIAILRGYEEESKFLEQHDLPEIPNSEDTYNSDGPTEDDIVH